MCWCGDIGCLLYTRDHLIFIDPPFCHLRAAACSCVMISLCLFNCSVYVDQIACGETDWQHQYLHHHNPTTTTTTTPHLQLIANIIQISDPLFSPPIFHIKSAEEKLHTGRVKEGFRYRGSVTENYLYLEIRVIRALPLGVLITSNSLLCGAGGE